MFIATEAISNNNSTLWGIYKDFVVISNNPNLNILVFF